jgi:hypothetical protein
VQGIEAAEPMLDGQRRSVFSYAFVDLDDGERRPLLTKSLARRRATGELHGAQGLDKAHAADAPDIGLLHRVAQDIAVFLIQVALDERACVQIETQRSASRSESTSSVALVFALTMRGGRVGSDRDGGVTRPSATS